jgi:hypothetical protein
VAHSITLVTLFSSAWTSETSGSSGRSATGLAILLEKRVPATLATSLAECELDSHVSVHDRPKRAGFAALHGFFLFKQIPSSADPLSTLVCRIRNSVKRK